ncbi:hypothetical protein [Bacilliculturomica massiliensis]|uniref:hypothetical protein n=1 Tax=Bacilliculturomica massiliensis TaxID=1917867 RepID=UPI00102F98D6|nr:hypothetical protein [Bacilliculturomica massiliensis]
MMKGNRKLQVCLAVLLLMLVPVMAACGGSDDPAGSLAADAGSGQTAADGAAGGEQGVQDADGAGENVVSYRFDISEDAKAKLDSMLEDKDYGEEAVFLIEPVRC